MWYSGLELVFNIYEEICKLAWAIEHFYHDLMGNNLLGLIVKQTT